MFLETKLFLFHKLFSITVFTFNIYCTHAVKISTERTFGRLLINKIFFFPISSAYLVYIFNDVKLTENLAIILSDWRREMF